jgi:hypothetical protein
MRAFLICCWTLLQFTLVPAGSAQQPMVELDHVYVVVPTGAEAEIALLRSHGFFVDSCVSRHTGYGTASRSVYFQNAYFELLWLDPSVEVAPEHEPRARLLRRAVEWRTSGVSPFGVGLHRVAGFTGPLPVPVQRDSAAYLEPGTAYEVLNQPADSLGADLFVVPADRSVPSWIARARERVPHLFVHPGGGRVVDRIRIMGPASQLTAALAVLRPGGVTTVQADSALLELRLDDNVRGQRLDLRPLLPVIVLR